MTPITTKLLKKLKFKKEHVPIEVSRDTTPYDYWTLDFPGISLITNASDEIVDDVWEVYIFDYDEYTFTDGDKLTEFVTAMRNVFK